jgi:hypothetical protein
MVRGSRQRPFGPFGPRPPWSVSPQRLPMSRCALRVCDGPDKEGQDGDNRCKDQDRLDERCAWHLGRAGGKVGSRRRGQARTCGPDHAAASRARSSRRFMFARSVALILRCAMPSPSAALREICRRARYVPHRCFERIDRWTQGQGGSVVTVPLHERSPRTWRCRTPTGLGRRR